MPDDTVREVIYPVVGGEATLKDLAAEYRAKGTEYQRQKRKVFKASYTNHYRRGLIRLLVPLDPAAFTAQLREEMRTELAALNDALPKLDWLRITDRKSGAIKLTPLDAQPETRNLRRLKKAVQARWGQVPLIDMVTEAALRTGMLGHLTAVGSREALRALRALGAPAAHRLVGDRVRDHPPARLRSATQDQADQHDQALPARSRRPRRLSAAEARDDPSDSLGAGRTELRPDDQVRDRDQGRHRVHRSDPAALQPATPRTPSTKRCSSSDARRRRSSSRATYATATYNAKSTKA
jgi:hypothetical protein